MSTSATEVRIAAGGAVARRHTSVHLIAPAIMAIGCGALAARTAVAAVGRDPTVALVAMFCGLLVCGAWLPLPDVRGAARAAARSRAGISMSILVTIVGIAAFATGRALVGGHAPLALSGYTVATSTLAAVAEEAWFRRLCFGLLVPNGVGFAIGGSAVLFAVVHVTSYGWWVLPLDLAAGVLLGWQRTVTGSWAAPAFTHVVANLLILL